MEVERGRERSKEEVILYSSDSYYDSQLIPRKEARLGSARVGPLPPQRLERGNLRSLRRKSYTAQQYSFFPPPLA